VSVLEDLSHLFQCDVECVGWGVFLRRGRVSVATPPAAFEIRGGRTDGHYGHAVGGGCAMAGWSHAPRRRKSADDDWANSVGFAGTGLGTFVWFDICSTRPEPEGAVLSAVDAGAHDRDGSARGVPADAHAGHSRGTSQLVFAAESPCVCTLGLRPLGVSDWSTVSAVVATLLAERADRVMGLGLGDRELCLHRQRRQFLVLLRVVLRRVCTRLRFDGERRPLAGRDGVIVIWRVLAPQMFHLHVGLLKLASRQCDVDSPRRTAFKLRERSI
jgi:hypothetical protein